MDKTIRYTIASILLFIALNAFGGGYYGMSGAKDVPLELLNGSPFKSYFIPGLILFFVVGGACLTSAILLFKDSILGRKAALMSSLILLTWIAVQVAMIGYVSWMQPAIAIMALLILILSFLLP